LRLRALVLSSVGYEVVSANNVDEALKILRTRMRYVTINDQQALEATTKAVVRIF
jgi:hypothetical protein